MRDARKEPLPGLCPRPQDFRRNVSGVRWSAIKTAPDNHHRQRPDASSAHRRPGYPLSGCVPAEPDSVSPGNHNVAARSWVRKYSSAPALCLKNPNRLEKASKSVQKLSEESKFTHSIGRRPEFKGSRFDGTYHAPVQTRLAFTLAGCHGVRRVMCRPMSPGGI